MAHKYEQSTGRWFAPNGRLMAVGFSGADPDPSVHGEPGEGINHPELEGERNVGPIPHGRYRICAPENHPHVGPFAMRLDALPGTDTHGRSGFFLHGGKRSKGCVLLPRAVREAIWASGDRVLEVVPGAPATPKENA